MPLRLNIRVQFRRMPISEPSGPHSDFATSKLCDSHICAVNQVV